MYYPQLADAEHVAFSHRVSDTTSHENEAIYLALPAVAWRTWRPFTRIGRAKRVGHQYQIATA